MVAKNVCFIAKFLVERENGRLNLHIFYIRQKKISSRCAGRKLAGTPTAVGAVKYCQIQRQIENAIS